VRIDSVDFFYLRMPEVLDIGDGSQDALLVRVRAGNYEGWGECEASPLTSIASWVAPISHSACKPLADTVLGYPLEGPEDVRRLHSAIAENSLDLLQADHTLSGIDIALWDLLGKRYEEPVWKVLNQAHAFAKRPYASVLFGDTPEETHARAVTAREQGFTAVKFGWGPYGRGSVEADARLVEAARAGLGEDVELMVDAGTVWGEDVEQACLRLPALQQASVSWLEEPFLGGALHAYRDLARRAKVPIAGGEGCHKESQARQMIDSRGVRFIQIDTGRIGGIYSAFRIAQYAASRVVKFVNHTFTSSLALSASLQPYANLASHDLCEYPLDPKPLARDLTTQRLEPSRDGRIHLPDAPGLGLDVDLSTIEKYLLEVEIKVGGRVLFRSDRSLI
jgi:L-alanine-DL-glutamate epimerase-like enolase superfamily enzyme